MSLSLAALLLSAVPAPVAPGRPTVAILYFDSSGRDESLAGLKKGLAQMLVSDLAAGDGVTVVERERLEEILAELKLGRTGALDAATAGRVGKLLGAQLMILGSYFSLAGALRVDARVVQVETGRVLHAAGATGKADDFLSVEQALAKTLGAFLASAPVPAPPPAPAGAPGHPARGATAQGTPGAPPERRGRASPPSALHLKTAVRYGQALDALDTGRREEAKSGLQAVLKEQPDFRLAAIDLDKLMR